MRFVILTLFLLFSSFFFGQREKTSYRTQAFHSVKKATVSPRSAGADFNPSLFSLEAPTPGGNGMKSYVLRQKIASRKQFPITKKRTKKNKTSALSPEIGKEFGTLRQVLNNFSPIYGGLPNDNTFAVSNDGIALMAMNSILYAYDLNTDEIVFTNSSNSISLATMSGEASTFGSFYFDPYLVYDEVFDRFILVFLKNNEPVTNKIFICFSTSADPRDPWNVYALEGNPLDNDRWTDYPVVSITEKDVFITGNLIIPNTTWQTGFDGSIIWQMEKKDGYEGADSLKMKLYSDIRFDGNFVRNLHAVRGADGVTDKLYLLSNRNFAIQNDTIFVLDIEGDLEDGDPVLTVNMTRSDVSYGMPPNGSQQDTDVSDTTSGLQTNDARILGGVKIGNQIQFVSNSVNPETGLAAVFHGIVNDLENPTVKGYILGSDSLDYGYPNIAWTGSQEDCDIETMIAFNYTSFTQFPGVGAVYHDNDGNYSDMVVLKEGENYVDRIPNSSYERWGDYFGMQRKFNDNGDKIYAYGFYGTENNRNSGWCTELINPNTDKTVHCFTDLGKDIVAYPNPSQDNITVQFRLNQDELVTAYLYDLSGSRVATIMERNASEGLNEFSFSLLPLTSGEYILELVGAKEILLTQKVIKF